MNAEYRREPFGGRHDPFMTPAEEDLGYPLARAKLAGYSNGELAEEYKQATRDSLGAMFGHNARKNLRLVAEELLLRGVTSIPNLFGDIEVKTWDPWS